MNRFTRFFKRIGSGIKKLFTRPKKPTQVAPSPASLTIKEARAQLKTAEAQLKEAQRLHGLKSWKKLAMIYYDNYKFRIDEKYRNQIPALIEAQTETINWGREDWIDYNGDKSYSDIQRFLAVFAILLGISYEELTGETLKPEEGIDEDIEGLY